MKLNPQQAPLYGQCVLTVQLNNDDEVEVEEEEVEFYCLFSGSTQRHVTSTVRVSRVTLQAVCPAHHVCEQVLVTLCWARPGAPVDSHSQETFTFVQDLALDMAHFLLDSTDPQEALLLDDEQIPLKVCKRLDQSLALALEHLSLPYHTRVQNLYNLLHLAASHGLWMVASFVLQQDGSREALRRADAQGQTAADVAKSRGHKKLGKLFTR
uniref:DBB domain-containing protein n=1 Tax=Cynoglossus semilaevis TaxID=244447 RepID=A0A3P8UID3_CYNSE